MSRALAPAPSPPVPARRTNRDASPEKLVPHLPWLTVGLVLLLVAIFCLQQHYGGNERAGFDVHTLTAEGGIDRHLVFDQGEWWRIFTAPLLHGSLFHLVGNVATLAIAGALLERIIGAAWFAALFAAGAIAGSFGSMAYTTLISIGASGAIMSLLTALFLLSFHERVERHGKRLRRFVLFLMIPALTPSAAQGGMLTDIGAHFGGALAGIAMGFLILILWPEEGARPPYTKAAATTGLVGLAAAFVAFAATAAHYPAYAAKPSELISAQDMPRNGQDAIRRSAELVRRYPHDPTAHLYRALYFLDRNNPFDAEPQLRDGLREMASEDGQYAPQLAEQLQGLLAVSLYLQGRTTDAAEAARPVCTARNLDVSIERTRAWLHQHGICGGQNVHAAR